MKRFIALLLCLVLALSACGAPKASGQNGNGEKSLDELTGAELYARAGETMALLSSYQLETVVSGGAKAVWTTCRVRTGLDNYAFSRVNENGEGVYFDGERAFLLAGDGRYTAAASTLSFQKYVNEYLFPVFALDGGAFSAVERDGNTVRYTGAGDSALAQFAPLTGAVPASVEGKAVVDEAGRITEEEITVGFAEGEKVTLKTRLVRFGETDFAVPAAPADGEYTELNDIRLPAMVRSAQARTLEMDNVSMTVDVQETSGGATRSTGSDFNGVGDAYSLRENAFAATAGEEGVYTVAHTLAENGKPHRVLYDASTAAVLADEDPAPGVPADRAAALASLLPDLTAFSRAEMTEEVNEYSVSFTLNQAGASGLLSAVFARLGQGAGGDDVTVTGTLTMDKKTGALTSVFYELQGSVTGRGSFALTYGNAALAPIVAPEV